MSSSPQQYGFRSLLVTTEASMYHPRTSSLLSSSSSSSFVSSADPLFKSRNVSLWTSTSARSSSNNNNNNNNNAETTTGTNKNKQFITSWGEYIKPYDILQLKRDCTSSEIKKSYYTLMKKYHPDRVALKNGILPGSCNNMVEVTQMYERIKLSYEILNDSTKRIRYDRADALDNPKAAIERATWNAIGWSVTNVGKGLGDLSKGMWNIGTKAAQEFYTNQQQQEQETIRKPPTPVTDDNVIRKTIHVENKQANAKAKTKAKPTTTPFLDNKDLSLMSMDGGDIPSFLNDFLKRTIPPKKSGAATTITTTTTRIETNNNKINVNDTSNSDDIVVGSSINNKDQDHPERAAATNVVTGSTVLSVSTTTSTSSTTTDLNRDTVSNNITNEQQSKSNIATKNTKGSTSKKTTKRRKTTTARKENKTKL